MYLITGGILLVFSGSLYWYYVRRKVSNSIAFLVFTFTLTISLLLCLLIPLDILIVSNRPASLLLLPFSSPASSSSLTSPTSDISNPSSPEIREGSSIKQDDASSSHDSSPFISAHPSWPPSSAIASHPYNRRSASSFFSPNDFETQSVTAVKGGQKLLFKDAPPQQKNCGRRTSW